MQNFLFDLSCLFIKIAPIKNAPISNEKKIRITRKQSIERKRKKRKKNKKNK